MMALVLALSSLPFVGYHGVADYRSCMLSAVVSHDDGQSDPDQIVLIAGSACLKEDMAMQAEWQRRVTDDLRDQEPAVHNIQLVSFERAKPAAQATRELVRDLAVSKVRYARNTHAQH